MEQVPILANGVRIFRPSELTAFLSGITKRKYRVMYEALFFTGMRYIEAKRLQRHHDWFDKKNKFIHLPEMAQRKKKQVQKERYVMLNTRGADKVDEFLELGKKLPTYNTWRENLIRWAKNGDVDPNGLSVKASRKTWEAFLVFYYPHGTEKIFLSQGHQQLTSLRFYLNMPFTAEDKADMKPYVEGWMERYADKGTKY